MTIEEIKFQCDIAWQEKFLELTGLLIGDEVDCRFHYSSGNAKQAWMSLTIRKGIIVRTDKGIFVKSKEKLPKARERKVYPNRTSSRTYWHFEDEHILAKLDNIVLPEQGKE